MGSHRSLREVATLMRRAGWSYTDICRNLGIAKSTASNWLSRVPYKPNATVRKRIKKGPARSAMSRNQKKLINLKQTRAQGKKRIGNITERDLLMLGIGLYIGEGSKAFEYVRVANADPSVIVVCIEWFQRICEVPLSHIVLTIHGYPDMDMEKVCQHWSKTVGIPLSQFGKSQIDLRPGKRKTKEKTWPDGTAHIRIKSCGDPRFGVELHRKIASWIEAVTANQRA